MGSFHFMTSICSLLLSIMMLTSCTSYFVRKDCEKTDWFAYGHQVAMSGKRLTGDEFVKRCEQAEAEISHVALDRGFKQGMGNYCKPDTAFQLGKSGEFFNAEFCDGMQPRQLTMRHAEGVRSHCAKSNAFSVGASGRKYNNICPKELEDTFMPEYNRGRKKYLTAQISEMENQIDDIDRDIRQLESERTNLTNQMNTVGDGKKITRVSTYDPATRTTKEELVSTVDEETKKRRDTLQSSLSSVSSRIELKRNEQDQLRRRIREHRTDLAGL
jgi:chorismate mutase